MDFLEAIAEETVEVTLATEQFTVKRAPLGRWFKLQLLGARLKELEPDSQESQDTLIAYVAVGVNKPIYWVREEPTFLELLKALEQVTWLNRSRGDMAYMHASLPKGAAISDGYDYTNRGLALIVHRLAKTYGWTRQHILEEVYPEEAFCYIQESLIDEYNTQRHEYEWNADVGVDKQGNKRPYPPLPWPKTGEAAQPKPLKIPAAAAKRGFVPQGTVIKIGTEKEDAEKPETAE